MATRLESSWLINGSYSLKEIGEYVGLHYSRVSRIVKRMQA